MFDVMVKKIFLNVFVLFLAFEITDLLERKQTSLWAHPGHITQPPSDSHNEEKFAMDTVPFVYLSHVSGAVGGYDATAKSQYISDSGLIQISQEKTSGVLQSLQIGNLEGQAHLRKSLPYSAVFHAKQEAKEKEGALELSEYTPPHLLVSLFFPQEGYLIESYLEENLPSRIRELITSVHAFVDRVAVQTAEPGLYVRAQRLPQCDPQITKMDAVLNISSRQVDEKLRRIVSQEMALIKVGREDDRIVLGGAFVIVPKGAVHVQINNRCYRMTAYVYSKG